MRNLCLLRACLHVVEGGSETCVLSSRSSSAKPGAPWCFFTAHLRLPAFCSFKFTGKELPWTSTSCR